MNTTEHPVKGLDPPSTLETFRALRRMVMMEAVGEEAGSNLLIASRAAADPANTLFAYGGILIVVFVNACCLSRWNMMRFLFQSQVALLNAMWCGLWLAFGIMATFTKRNPLGLVRKEIFSGFSLLLMCLYLYVAACNLFTLA